MDTNKIIDDVIEREGPPSDDPDDRGGRTQFGIAEKHHPEAWADGKVTEDEARAIYLKKYVESPNFHLVKDPLLRSQLIDFGVNSGPSIATMKLQEILGVKADGKVGPITLGALDNARVETVNNALVVARVKMLAKIVQKNPSQLKFLGGWINRAFEFLVLRHGE